ncbi:MAG TPA: VCBS repeat-containing protein, partial [Candidatus Paceibacterota bacterium]|nr:VCBS repeat-containing protein [Candidatus Paceibacterota bacterium]
LYRNLGQWRFEDVTQKAGVACAGQASSGTVFADVDADGDLDLMVNGVGTGVRLFQNNGKGLFQESTRESGLRGGDGGTSLALADIDGNGTLDLYAANYRSTTWRDELDARFKAATVKGRYEIIAVNGRPVTEPDLVGRYTYEPNMGILENGEADVVYRNDGQGRFTPLSWTDGTFLDEDGKPISVPYDWALSVMFRDLNEDGRPDIYVCNDFHSPDRIWINNGRGGFHAIGRLAIRQTSIFSMGMDFADIDRDGHDDFFVADMLSRHHASRQVQLMDRRPVQLPVGQIEDRPQYSRNTLFWNRGDGAYAEIAHFSGIAASEWTWCPAFLDVDLDGFEDLLCVTGHVRDAQNIDISRRIEALRRTKPMSKLEQLNLRRMFTRLEVPNFAFRNRGDLTFEEMGASWGFNSRKVCQGIAFADFDNDGDLDVAINCLDDTPLILRNDSIRPRVVVRLKGLPPNTRGIGAKIQVTQADLPVQSQEMICGGHYLSGDDPIRVFAAGKPDAKLTISVKWRSGRTSMISEAAPNRLYEIFEPDAAFLANSSQPLAQGVSSIVSNAQTSQIPRPVPPPFFQNVSHLIDHRHAEEPFDDYQRQPLLPFKLSQLGPGVCWFDANGDGWEDLIIPSGRGGQLAVCLQDGQGAFVRVQESPNNAIANRDQTTALGWMDAKGKPSLLIGTANYEDGLISEPSTYLCDPAAMSMTDGTPGQSSSTGPLVLADFDSDGNLELIVGGRIIPGRFPEPAASHVYRLTAGKWQQNPKASDALALAGLVSGALASDLDGDGLPELVLACAGGPIRVFHFEADQFREITDKLGFGQWLGLWNSVSAGDFDGDGKMDLVAGNWGCNSKYQGHLSPSLHFYHGDLNGDGNLEVIEAYFAPEMNKIVPWRDWETVASALPFIRERYQDFTSFSTAGVNEFLGERLSGMKDLSVNTLESMVFMNRGDRFEAHPLPRETQFSPVFGLCVGDLDGDGHQDIYVCQNFFQVPPQISRLDGGRGVWCKGNGKGGFSPMNGHESGLLVYGEGRGSALCDYDHDGRLDLAVAQNGNATQLFH